MYGLAKDTDASEPHAGMHVAIVMNNTSGVATLRSDLIRFLQAKGHRVSVVCAPDERADEVRKMGVPLVGWKLSRSGLNPIAEALSVVRLRGLLARLGADVVLNFTPKVVLYSSIAGQFVRRSTVCSVFAGLGFLFSDGGILPKAIRPVLRVTFRLALRKNDLVFFQNPDDQRQFVAEGIVRRCRTRRVNGSGVDTHRFARTAERAARSETTYIMIARLLEQKGVLEYLRATAILKHEGCAVRAVLVGPFDEHPSAVDRSVLREYVDSGVVVYRGATKDVRPYLDDADVFVLPSYYREGTPRSALEAMAMAMPIITTDWPGCRETVIDGHNGYMVPVRDVGRLAAAMRRFVGQRKMIRKMGRRSRRIAEERYDVNKVNGHMLNEILRMRSIREKRSG